MRFAPTRTKNRSRSLLIPRWVTSPWNVQGIVNFPSFCRLARVPGAFFSQYHLIWASLEFRGGTCSQFAVRSALSLGIFEQEQISISSITEYSLLVLLSRLNCQTDLYHEWGCLNGEYKVYATIYKACKMNVYHFACLPICQRVTTRTCVFQKPLKVENFLPDLSAQ